jgi:hypothetical protein
MDPDRGDPRPVPADGVREALADLAGAVAKHLEEIVDQIVAASRIELTVYMPRQTSMWVPTLQSDARVMVQAFLGAVAERRLFSPLELEAVTRFGSRTSSTRAPGSALARVQRMSERAIRGALRVQLSQRSATERLALIRHINDLMGALEAQIQADLAKAILDAWGSGSIDKAPWAGGEEQPSPLGLLLDGDVEAFRASTRADKPPFGPNASYVVVAVGLLSGREPPQLGLPEVASRISQAVEGSEQPAIAMRRGTAVVVVPGRRDAVNRPIADATAKVLEADDPGTTLVAGVGRPESGLHGVNASYASARMAVEVAMMSTRMPRVLTDDDAIPYALLSRDPRLGHQVVRAAIEPLRGAGQRFKVLFETLDAYVATAGNVAETAKLLGIHRHTLYGRIERIESLTGRKLSRPEDLLLMTLGLRAMQLFPYDIDTSPAASEGDTPSIHSEADTNSTE